MGAMAFPHHLIVGVFLCASLLPQSSSLAIHYEVREDYVSNKTMSEAELGSMVDLAHERVKAEMVKANMTPRWPTRNDLKRWVGEYATGDVTNCLAPLFEASDPVWSILEGSFAYTDSCKDKKDSKPCREAILGLTEDVIGGFTLILDLPTDCFGYSCGFTKKATECTSSQLVVHNPPEGARTYSTWSSVGSEFRSLTAWSSALGDPDPWMQLDLQAPKVLYGVVTQGSPVADQWVTSFKVSIQSPTDDSLVSVDQTFEGNSDRNTEKRNYFDNSAKLALIVRFKPLASSGGISMRAAVLECPQDDSGEEVRRYPWNTNVALTSGVLDISASIVGMAAAGFTADNQCPEADNPGDSLGLNVPYMVHPSLSALVPVLKELREFLQATVYATDDDGKYQRREKFASNLEWLSGTAQAFAEAEMDKENDKKETNKSAKAGCAAAISHLAAATSALFGSFFKLWACWKGELELYMMPAVRNRAGNTRAFVPPPTPAPPIPQNLVPQNQDAQDSWSDDASSSGSDYWPWGEPSESGNSDDSGHLGPTLPNDELAESSDEPFKYQKQFKGEPRPRDIFKPRYNPKPKVPRPEIPPPKLVDPELVDLDNDNVPIDKVELETASEEQDHDVDCNYADAKTLRKGSIKQVVTETVCRGFASGYLGTSGRGSVRDPAICYKLCCLSKSYRGYERVKKLTWCAEGTEEGPPERIPPKGSSDVYSNYDYGTPLWKQKSVQEVNRRATLRKMKSREYVIPIDEDPNKDNPDM